MPKVYVHKPLVWLPPVAGALGLLGVIGVLASWDQPDRMLPFVYLSVQFGLMSFHANKLQYTVLTDRLLWDSSSRSAPISQITELELVGRDRWLVKWSSRLKRQATFTMSPGMAEELRRRIDQVNPQDKDLTSPGFAPISWVPIVEHSELVPIRNQPPTNFTIPLSLAVLFAVGLAFYTRLTLWLLVVPIVGVVFAYLTPRVGRILADGYLIEVNHEGVLRTMFVVGASMHRTKSGLWELQDQGNVFTLVNGGPIAAKLLGKFTPTKKKAAQEQQGRCLLCGESFDHVADGTVTICQHCQNRVRIEAELAGHGVR